MIIQEWDGCPIRFAAGIFGDKWCLVILRDLIFKSKHYYGEFLEGGEGISPNILADRLSRLVDQGILEKHLDSEKASKYIYKLTTRGLDLIPTMLAIIEWSYTHDKNSLVSKDYVEEYRKNRVRFEKKARRAAEENVSGT